MKRIIKYFILKIPFFYYLLKIIKFKIEINSLFFSFNIDKKNNEKFNYSIAKNDISNESINKQFENKRYKILKELSIDYYKTEILTKIKDYKCVKRNNFRNAKENINILQVNTIYGKGGASKIVLQINDNLDKNIFKNKILVRESDDENKNLIILKNKNNKLTKYLSEFENKEGWYDFFRLSSFNIKNINEFKNADLVHYHNLHGGYFSPFALPELTSLKPSLWTIHDTQAFTGHCATFLDCSKWIKGCNKCPYLNVYPSLKKDATKFIWENKKKIYNKSNITLICPSQWLMNILKKSILKDKDIRLIYNGINTNIFKKYNKIKARQILNLPIDKKILLFSLYSGKDNFAKGGEYILKLYGYIKNNKNLFFINLSSELHFENETNWINVPYVKDEQLMAMYYSSSDLYLHPSLAETFGLSIAESLSCGTPVIAFDTGPIPEIIEHLKTGYLSAYRDSNDFIKGVKLFLENDELRKKASIYGSLLINKKFSLENMIANYANLYTEIIK